MQELSKAVDLIVKGMDNRQQLNLAFTLAQEEYGRGGLKVEKVLGLMSVGTIRQDPGAVKWRLFFPGEMPVCGVKCRFSGQEIEVTERTWILVAEIAGASGLDLVGFLMDTGPFAETTACGGLSPPKYVTAKPAVNFESKQ